MTSPLVLPSTNSLQQTRDLSRVLLCSVYLVGALLYSVKYHPVFPQALGTPRYLAAALCLILIILTPSGVLSRPAVRQTLQFGFIPLLFWTVLQVSQQPTQTGELMLWMMLLLPTFALNVGGSLGLLGSALCILALLTGFALQTGGEEQWMLWLTALLTSGGIAAAMYLLTNLLEQHLMMYEKASNQLQQATTDNVTSVANRTKTDEEFGRAIASARQHRQALSIIVADIDHFKSVNDQHGHNTGDEVLGAFSKRLRRNVGALGMVGRWGGEEFIVILPGMPREDALKLAEHLREEVAQTPIVGLNITASFGVASLRHHLSEDEENGEKL